MKNRKIVGLVATAVVVGLVVTGLFAVGSPANARKERADAERYRRLVELHAHLVSHSREEGALPAGLKDLEPRSFDGFGEGFDPQLDPNTGKAFEYRKLGDRDYEICAVFQTSSDGSGGVDWNNSYYGVGPLHPLEPYDYAVPLGHDAGRNCFDRTISKAELDNRFVPAPPPPAPPGEAP